MFQYLRVKRQIEKVVPDAGALTQDPDVPITLRQINALPENAKVRVYRNHAFEPSRALCRMWKLTHHAEVIAILPEFERDIWSFDGSMIPYVIEEGARSAEKQMPYIRRLLTMD